MTFRVEFTLSSAEQAEAAAIWWRTHRPDSSDLFQIELGQAIALLREFPPLTQVWLVLEGTEIRRVRLPRSNYAIYFSIHASIVTVHAVWHGARGTPPEIP
ncbi:MAG: hypothetical protein KBF88_09640 [Polyangiaceae bacterium]|nr:hypothetical protein [Polyangiaceae bacterium]